MRGKESWLLYLCCVLNVMSQLSFLTFPPSAMCWSVVCDCGISCSYSLAFDFCSSAIDLKLNFLFLFYLVLNVLTPVTRFFHSEKLRHTNAYKSLIS